MKIITNNIPRLLIDLYELDQKERPDYETEGPFFRYKENLYDLSEFLRTPDELKDWDGYSPESFFSGVLVKYAKDDPDRVIVGRYYS